MGKLGVWGNWECGGELTRTRTPLRAGMSEY